MKKEQHLQMIEGFQDLSTDELQLIDGGSFWRDAAKAAGFILRNVYDFLDESLDHSSTFTASSIGAPTSGAGSLTNP